MVKIDVGFEERYDNFLANVEQLGYSGPIDKDSFEGQHENGSDSE